MIRRFTDYFPEPRDKAWARVLVREAPDATALLVPIGGLPLPLPWQVDDLDYSPSGEYVTEHAALEGEAWYQLVFVDDTGDMQPAEPEAAPPAWAPSVRDVADVSQGYTRAPIASGGLRRGTFDATTTPTEGEVRGYIAAAVEEVRGRVGALVEPDEYELARTAAKWHAAATVEAEHGNPASDVNDAFAWKRSSYVAALQELQRRVRGGALRLS